MRIGSLIVDGVQRYGVVDDHHINLLAESADVFDVLESDDPSVALTGHRLAWESTTELAVPVPVASIRDFITFEQHTAGSLRAVTGAAEIPDAWYEAPAFYFTNPHAAIGSGATVPMPPGCKVLDFELEVAVVIGRAGYNLSVDEAFDHVAGFTILNDWSARDLQGREMRVGLGTVKGKDTATTLGPGTGHPRRVRRLRGRWSLRPGHGGLRQRQPHRRRHPGEHGVDLRRVDRLRQPRHLGPAR